MGRRKFADSLSDLLKVPSLSVVSNQERKIIQQKLRVPLTSLPSLATSLKLARESKASILIAGKYNIVPAQGGHRGDRQRDGENYSRQRRQISERGIS